MSLSLSLSLLTPTLQWRPSLIWTLLPSTSLSLYIYTYTQTYNQKFMSVLDLVFRNSFLFLSLTAIRNRNRTEHNNTFGWLFHVYDKVANPTEKPKNFDERRNINDSSVSSMPIVFPGMNREREMSAIVSALTHVVAGDLPPDSGAVPAAGGGAVMLNSPSESATPSSSSSSYGANSALKRSREDDTNINRSFGNMSHQPSSPAIIQTSRYHNIFKFNPFPTFFFG